MSNILANILGQQTGGILGIQPQTGGIAGPAQPPVQGPTTTGVGRLFQNPAFLSALSSLSQTAFTPQAPGERFGTTFARGLSGFAPNLIRGQQQQEALQVQRQRQQLADRLIQAQITQSQLQTAAIPGARALERRKVSLSERKFDQDVRKFETDLNKGIDSDELFKRGTKLRTEFTGLSKDFIKQRDAFGRIQISAANPSAAGDIALIFNFMKVNDPGSTVREGEFATAQNAAGVPARVRAQFNKLLSGERLTPGQRTDFVKTSRGLFESAQASQDKRVSEFTRISNLAGVDPQQVIIDLGLAQQEATQEVAQEAIPTGQSVFQENQTATNPQTGQKLIFRGGRWQPQ